MKKNRPAAPSAVNELAQRCSTGSGAATKYLSVYHAAPKNQRKRLVFAFDALFSQKK